MPEKVDPEIAEMLMPEEEIIFVASQSKVAPGGTLYSPTKVYITHNRLLFKDPKWFGLKSNIIDITYTNISTVMLKRGVFTTEIYVKPKFSSQKIRLPAVDKKIAMQVSMLIKKGMRGELLNPQKGQEVESVKRKDDDMDRLERLVQMRQEGVLTEQELRVMKEELMLSIRPDTDLDSEMNRKTDAYHKSATIITSKQYPEQSDIPRGLTFCRYCNFTGLPTGAKFCPECGQKIAEQSRAGKICPLCENLTTDDATFCMACNKKLSRH